ncbi:MAG: PD40 domain-containing protein [Chitinivibrionia bacterium]|nr:PD40 domain-containing protein [Chitinivibrionia bacterium]
MISLLVLVLLCVWSGANAQTEVELGIKSTSASKIPLWMESFRYGDQGSKHVSQQMDQLVYSDLEFSGLFAIARGRPNPGGSGGGGLEVVVRGSVTPDGGRYLFEGRVIDAASGHLIGGKRYPVTDKTVRKIAHHFSDEIILMLTGERGVAGTKILFVRTGGGKWELVMSDYDGYEPRALLRLSLPILNPRWVDGREALAYTGFLHGKPDLFLRRLDESASKPIATYKGLNYSIDWSQRRKELLATLSKDGNPELYIMDRKGTIKNRLTHSRSIDCNPTWSPNGREVIFTSDRSGGPQLYRMEGDGSNVRRLTFQGNYNSSAAWSPKGDWVAFASRINGIFQLCLIKPDGTGMHALTDEPWNHDTPRWAPDGRHLIYAEDRSPESTISIIDIYTKGKRILSKGKHPDWSPE